METKKIVCIVCPTGCRLTVDKKDKEYIINGNKCKRGIDYAIAEIEHPTRVLTSTVKIENGIYSRLPVNTSGVVPKGKIFDCMVEINKVVVESPISIGEVIIKNVAGTGVDIVASRSM